MTLPTTITLPPYAYRESDPNAYFYELTTSIENMYTDIVGVVNGTTRRNVDPGRSNWTPILKGTTISGTFTYNHQVGWVLRQGIITDCFFDVSWSSSGAATGNLYLELPYKVALVDEKPFVGLIQMSSLTLTAGTNIVINGISNTFRGELWTVGDGIATANQAIADSGSGQLIGHIRYIGQENE